MKLYKYDVYNYSVEGNTKDGFEVKGVFRGLLDVVLPKEVVMNNKKLIRELKKPGLIEKGVHAGSIGVYGHPENTMYFFDLRRKAGGYCPLFEMRCKLTLE
jgi:hypothetical protein